MEVSRWPPFGTSWSKIFTAHCCRRSSLVWIYVTLWFSLIAHPSPPPPPSPSHSVSFHHSLSISSSFPCYFTLLSQSDCLLLWWWMIICLSLPHILLLNTTHTHARTCTYSRTLLVVYDIHKCKKMTLHYLSLSNNVALPTTTGIVTHSMYTNMCVLKVFSIVAHFIFSPFWDGNGFEILYGFWSYDMTCNNKRCIYLFISIEFKYKWAGKKGINPHFRNLLWNNPSSKYFS